jgi:hypothetical protein
MQHMHSALLHLSLAWSSILMIIKEISSSTAFNTFLNMGLEGEILVGFVMIRYLCGSMIAVRVSMKALRMTCEFAWL